MQELNDPVFLEELIQETDGVPVVHGADSTWGHEGAIDEALFQAAQVYGVERFVKVPTGRLPAVKVDEAVTVDGANFVVRGAQRLDEGNDDLTTDGALTVLFLANP